MKLMKILIFQLRDVIDTGEALPILEIVDKDQNVIRQGQQSYQTKTRTGILLGKASKFSLFPDKD